jgi:hypothetical protein
MRGRGALSGHIDVHRARALPALHPFAGSGGVCVHMRGNTGNTHKTGQTGFCRATLLWIYTLPGAWLRPPPYAWNDAWLALVLTS